MHVDGGPRKGASYVTDAAGVVEMDVGDDHSGQFVGGDAETGQLVEEHGHRALASGLDEDGCVTLEQVAGGHLLPAPEQCVDLDHPIGNPRPAASAERLVVMVARVGSGHERRAGAVDFVVLFLVGARPVVVGALLAPSDFLAVVADLVAEPLAF